MNVMPAAVTNDPLILSDLIQVYFSPQVSCVVGSYPPSADSRARFVNLAPPLFPRAQNYLLLPGKWEETEWRSFTSFLKKLGPEVTFYRFPFCSYLIGEMQGGLRTYF